MLQSMVVDQLTALSPSCKRLKFGQSWRLCHCTWANSAHFCAQGTAAYATSTVQLTAMATPVIAVIVGPQGDVLSTNPIAFSSASIDPDAVATPSGFLVTP